MKKIHVTLKLSYGWQLVFPQHFFLNTSCPLIGSKFNNKGLYRTNRFSDLVPSDVRLSSAHRAGWYYIVPGANLGHPRSADLEVSRLRNSLSDDGWWETPRVDHQNVRIVRRYRCLGFIPSLWRWDEFFLSSHIEHTSKVDHVSVLYGIHFETNPASPFIIGQPGTQQVWKQFACVYVSF